MERKRKQFRDDSSLYREILSERYMKKEEGCWVVPLIKRIDGMYHSGTNHRVWLTESRCVKYVFSDQGPCPLSHNLMKQMIIKSEATGGPMSSAFREGLGEVCNTKKDKLKRRWYLVVRKMHLVLNPPAQGLPGCCWLLTLLLTPNSPCT